LAYTSFINLLLRSMTMELKHAKRIAEWLREHAEDDTEEQARAQELAKATVCSGVLRDDPGNDYGTVDTVALGIQLAEEARLLNKPILWAWHEESETTYFFIGAEDEILEKLK
jgi:hypothetical protein